MMLCRFCAATLAVQADTSPGRPAKPEITWRTELVDLAVVKSAVELRVDLAPVRIRIGLAQSLAFLLVQRPSRRCWLNRAAPSVSRGALFRLRDAAQQDDPQQNGNRKRDASDHGRPHFSKADEAIDGSNVRRTGPTALPVHNSCSRKTQVKPAGPLATDLTNCYATMLLPNFATFQRCSHVTENER